MSRALSVLGVGAALLIGSVAQHRGFTVAWIASLALAVAVLIPGKRYVGANPHRSKHVAIVILSVTLLASFFVEANRWKEEQSARSSASNQTTTHNPLFQPTAFGGG